MEGLTAISQLEELPEAEVGLSQPELLETQARLMLAGKTLGGLVTTEHLPEAYLKNRMQTEETRGHNWELLRQRAEANGLYFDPLGFARSSTHALLWIAREDVTSQSPKWDGRFLGIADPFNDSRLKNWTGYTEKRYFDASGLPIDAETAKVTPGATSRQLIPLALYALEYPKVPLVLVDFRDTHKPKNREMFAKRLAMPLAACSASPSSEIGRTSPVPSPGTSCARAMAIPIIARLVSKRSPKCGAGSRSMAPWTPRCVRNCSGGWRSWA